MKNILKVNYYKLGVLLDLDCHSSDIIFQQVNYEPRPDFHTYLTTPVDRHLDNMHRFNYNLVLQLRDYYNFSMHLTRATSWGYLINGTFNGIIGDMIKGIVDIGVTPFMFKSERIDVCEYTVQSYFARAAIIFRHPKTNDIRNNFSKPFTEDVWWIIAITVVIYWGMVYFITKFEKKYIEKSRRKTNYPALDSLMNVLAAATQQDSTDLPTFYSGRIAFLSLFVWGLLINQFYSASVVGFLLSEPTRFINTLEDLVNSNLEVGIEDMAYNYDVFATTTDPVVINLYHRKIAADKKRKKANFMSAIEGLEKVRKGGFAFQVDVATAYKIIDETFKEEEICELAEITLLPGKHTSTATAKHSPFKKMVTYGLRQVIEHGTAERLKHVWQHKRPKCPESHSSKPTPVPLTEFTPLIFLLVLGSSVSAIIMLVENCIRQYRAKHRLSLKKILQVEDHYSITYIQ
ncbi:ionotropic receptor 75a-like isoform X2 [Belonocnema kinseyi]|uniref:ionotropic receptor 75a-like isoform X2 n=1 Tax=Belonocnema kinseyi TaxID=2817044 RepID=UPI00143D2D44|nr:ionotropic receptor 75a-like isoform X2 [Belonocnema kinseyi]